MSCVVEGIFPGILSSLLFCFARLAIARLLREITDQVADLRSTHECIYCLTFHVGKVNGGNPRPVIALGDSDDLG